MTSTSSVPLVGLIFPSAEYECRLQRVFEAMERANLDALLVTAHGNLQYLSGYDGRGAIFMPFPLILVPGQKPTLVVREFDLRSVRLASWVEDIVHYREQTEFAQVCADAIRKFGLKGRIGLELGCWNLAPADVNALQAELPDLKFVDASRLVATVAAVKTKMELEVMRSAMKMTDLAVKVFQRSLREGISEAEVAANIESEVEQAGGTVPASASSSTLLFGERTKLPHGSAKNNAIRNNEPAFMEMGGVQSGYHCGLVRSAVLGRHPETESLHDLSIEVLEAAISVIRPGATAGEVDAAGRKVLERHGRPGLLNHRVGYQTGINWVERGYISLEPGAKDILEPNMTLHMPIILCGENGYVFGTSEHVVVTEQGSEILSSTPHTLYRA
ncbi:MAG: aminopeptidase P family protein [Mesorhizobium sp.]|uniref:M24 family metallopeptidase n=1 Tax=unclassified Mesorhizobium TaxID=325217 RepID=UPI000FD1D25E|nr:MULTISPECIES: Xaa-Pro peptidase family protein [unclassified Mesorhizobium]TGU88430.1 aminopeptidase P family protein [Mesorhizobium sp. M00.F.Ca.ET.151.01.1.1]TGV56092.1 aminopeptidase P family protein [bacterium M00.F.Ca.ET.141.01.1.1]RUW81132.1 aminopeptidase P family protein [Mesorhizobium sp. M2A.F.Ca.ET.067.02.1.1]RWB85642.1 MAG: aminopeptidase P family protein [Mesorhizobium sp.]RWD77114.1 MAG: aminopeptidase P family protein [Mesorhizobium sp.]